MFTNVIERDLGIDGKCLDSIHYMMFMVTSSEGDSFSCLRAISLEIPFQKILKKKKKTLTTIASKEYVALVCMCIKLYMLASSVLTQKYN